MLQATLLLALQSGYAASDLPTLERYTFELEPGAELGAALENVGDWNADGIDDYAVGSPSHNFQDLFGAINDHGRVEVRSGADDSVIASTGKLFNNDGARLGVEIAGGFDVDQDGQPELAATVEGLEQVIVFERSLLPQNFLSPVATLSASSTASLVERSFGAALANVG
ncbi:MAG: integrin alpha, partial [Planctomycetota bacterium]